MTTPTDDDLDGFEDLLSDDTPEQGSPWAQGEVITTLVSGSTQNWGAPFLDLSRVYTRGDKIEVTAATLEHRADLLALVDDPTEQIRKWGEQRWHRGHLDVERWTERGDAYWIIARDEARAVARGTIDPVERAERYAVISERFGSAPQASTPQYRDWAAERRLAEDLHRRAQQPRAVHRSTAD